METVLVIVALAGVFVLAVIAWRVDGAAQDDFEERFPPISDAEFIARCEPGCDPVVAVKVRKIVSEQLKVEYARIDPSSRLIEDLRAD